MKTKDKKKVDVDDKILIDRNVVEFANKIAKTLLESRSSTALFFVQQAFPDDVDGLEQRSVDNILTNIINQTSKHCE